MLEPNMCDFSAAPRVSGGPVPKQHVSQSEIIFTGADLSHWIGVTQDAHIEGPAYLQFWLRLCLLQYWLHLCCLHDITLDLQLPGHE